MFNFIFYIRLLLFSVYLLYVWILNENASKTFQKLKARQLEKTEQTNIIQNCETFRAIEPEVDTY